MVDRAKIVAYLDERLRISDLDDYSVNGLQVEGAREVRRIGLATDAALQVYRAAADAGCEMIVAHHGMVWGGIKRVTGRERVQLGYLFEHDINLYAAHLPLDVHPELGNNAVLAEIAGLGEVHPFGAYHGVRLGVAGTLDAPVAREALVERLRDAVGGEPVVLPFGPERITSVGIVSGSGSSVLSEAVESGLDCFVTGDARHEDHHLALEGALNVVYLGHYHSETVGVRALGRELEREIGVETVFLDVPTIV